MNWLFLPSFTHGKQDIYNYGKVTFTNKKKKIELAVKMRVGISRNREL